MNSQRAGGQAPAKVRPAKVRGSGMTITGLHVDLLVLLAGPPNQGYVLQQRYPPHWARGDIPEQDKVDGALEGGLNLKL